MIVIADSNIFISALITPNGVVASVLAEKSRIYKKYKIWTGDNALANALKEKGYDICITTTELRHKLYKKSNGSSPSVSFRRSSQIQDCE